MAALVWGLLFQKAWLDLMGGYIDRGERARGRQLIYVQPVVTGNECGATQFRSIQNHCCVRC